MSLIAALVGLILFLAVIGVLFWALQRIISVLPISETFSTIIYVSIVVIGVIVAVTAAFSKEKEHVMKSLGIFTAKNAQGVDPWSRRVLDRMPDAHQDTVNGCAYGEYGGKPSPRNNVVWDDGTTYQRTAGARYGTPKSEPATMAEGGGWSGNRSGE